MLSVLPKRYSDRVDRVEFGARPPSCGNSCSTHSNMATIRMTKVTYYLSPP